VLVQLAAQGLWQFVKDNCSKETAAGTRAKGKEQAAQYAVHDTKAH
jgi:hypothetical protein